MSIKLKKIAGVVNMPTDWYDKWKTRVPEDPEEVDTCDHCNSSISIQDEIYKTSDNEVVHEGCFETYAKEVLHVRIMDGQQLKEEM